MKKTVTLQVSPLLVAVLVLIASNIVTLVLWQPWEPSSERKVTISGQATVKAVPDEFIFSPYFERKTSAEISTLSADITKKIIALGVKEDQIKTSASVYDKPELYIAPSSGGDVQTTLSLQITVDNKELAQKVQDYLITTAPKGSISPYPTFSQKKQKELEDQARDEAVADAKKRAEKMASGLGAKIGKVLAVDDGMSGGGVMPMAARDMSVSTSGGETKITSLTVQPGQSEVSMTVEVTYQLR